MNREIKFRAWDGKQMVFNPAPTTYALHRFFGFITDEAPLMQYTGLKDVSGKEIYEGDIVRLNDYQYDVIRPVVFYRGAFCIHGFNWNERATEVIGNIYENPELL